MPRFIRARYTLPFLVAACGTFAACSSDAPRAPDLASRLERDTGTRWAVITDDRDGEVRFVAPEHPVVVGVGDPEKDARSFFARYADALHATSDDTLHLREAYADDLGTHHVVFDHFLPGTTIQVFDSASVARFRDGALVVAEPAFRHDLTGITTNPTLTKEAALRAAIDHVTTACKATDGVQVEGDPTLGVHAFPGDPARLAYRVDLTASGRCWTPEVDVDALDGHVLSRVERTASATAEGTGFRGQVLEMPDKKTLSVTDNALVSERVPSGMDETDVPPRSMKPVVTTRARAAGAKAGGMPRSPKGDWDVEGPGRGSAVDAHAYAVRALEYFKTVHDRWSYDDKGSALTVVVHDNTAQNDGGQNAFWSQGTITFGDGAYAPSGNLYPLSTGFDVVVHELAHGVTAHTSKLAYMYESGALNEAFSDIMAASAEAWDSGDTAPEARLLVGEAVTVDHRGFRNMDKPSEHKDPGHYSVRRGCQPNELPDTDANDTCGVHGNSAIPNKAFALMVRGGVNAWKDKTGKWVFGPAYVQQVTWEEARKLWFHSFVQMRKPHALFKDAALEQIITATYLNPLALGSTYCAWTAVGVLTGNEVPWLQTELCKSPPGFDPTTAAPAADTAASDAGTAPPSTDGAKSDAGAAEPSSGATHDGPCSKVGDGYVCNPNQSFGAFTCKDGWVVGGLYCEDSTMHCKPASATDPTATVVDNALVCE